LHIKHTVYLVLLPFYKLPQLKVLRITTRWSHEMR